MNRLAGRRPEQWTRRPVRHRRRNRLQLGRLLLGITLFASTLATPVGVAAASTVVEAENVGKTLPASASSRTTTRVTTQTSSSTEFFDCEGDRGGVLYQVIWKEDYDSDVKYPEGLSTNRDSNNKKGLKLFSLKKYDPATAKYTIVAEYSYKDIDGTGKGNPNGLSLDPDGRAYVTYSHDKDNKYVSLIRLLPGVEPDGKYPNPSHEVIA